MKNLILLIFVFTNFVHAQQFSQYFGLKGGGGLVTSSNKLIESQYGTNAEAFFVPNNKTRFGSRMVALGYANNFSNNTKTFVSQHYATLKLLQGFKIGSYTSKQDFIAYLGPAVNYLVAGKVKYYDFDKSNNLSKDTTYKSNPLVVGANLSFVARKRLSQHFCIVIEPGMQYNFMPAFKFKSDNSKVNQMYFYLNVGWLLFDKYNHTWF